MFQSALTGRVRHRVSRWKHKLILQVEITSKVAEPCGPDFDVRTIVYWRDALPTDLTTMKEQSWLKRS